MKQDLNSLKLEFERALAEGGFVIFRGIGRLSDQSRSPIYWDSERHADPKRFLEVASALGVKLVVFHDREFSSSEIEEAFERLESRSLPRDEYREVERNLRKLKAYEGFTCVVEVSFDHQGETYLYDLSTPWYDEFMTILDGLDDAESDGRDEGQGPMGFYSQN